MVQRQDVPIEMSPCLNDGVGKRVSSRCSSFPSTMEPKMVRPLVAPRSIAKKFMLISFGFVVFNN